MDLDTFMAETINMVKQNIAYAEETSSWASASHGINENMEVPPQEECPVCRRKTLARKFSSKTKKHFWVCEEKSCVHPTIGKSVFYADS
jgi:hypothetical protein